jgi:hypothetical protein
MDTRRSFLIAGGLALIPSSIGSRAFAAAGASPTDYIRALGNRVLEVINGNSSLEQKRAYLDLPHFSGEALLHSAVAFSN